MNNICQKELNFTVFWSPDDEMFIAICDQYSSLSCLRNSWHSAMRGILSLVEDADNT